jgi:predicted nucleic acid-binding protein
VGLIRADTSAWIEYFRGHGNSHAAAIRDGLLNDGLAFCDPVALELACWPGPESVAHTVQTVLARCAFLDQVPHEDVQVAGALYRTCRRAGETIRRANDCLIAAIAIRNDLPVLHRDREYDVIATHTRLQQVNP